MLGDAPLAYWPLDDPATYTDATGHGYALSLIGTPSVPLTTPGPVAGETAPLFSGSNGLYRASTFAFSPYAGGVHQPFSLELWIYGWTAPDQTAFWWGDDRAAQSAEVLALYTESYPLGGGGTHGSGDVEIYGQYFSGAATANIFPSLWTYVALTYDPTVSPQVHFYANGGQTTTMTTTALSSADSPFSANPTGTALYIGALPAAEVSLARFLRFLTGAVAHVAFYGSALSLAQANAHYAAASQNFSSYSYTISYHNSTTMDLEVSADTTYGIQWTPSSTIAVSFNGASLGTVATDATGHPVDTHFYPAIVPAGTYVLELAQGAVTKRQYVTVPGGDIYNFATTGTGQYSMVSSGAPFELQGDTLVPSSTVTVTLDGALLGTAVADTGGNLDHTFTLPAMTPGTHTLSATDGVNSAALDVFCLFAGSVASTTYRTEVLADTPVAFLPLTEAGTAYADISSGAAHAGTRLGAGAGGLTGPGLFSGETAAYLANSGTLSSTPLDGYIRLANPLTLPTSGAWSYEIWMNPHLSGTTYFGDGFAFSIEGSTGLLLFSWEVALNTLSLSTTLWTPYTFAGLTSTSWQSNTYLPNPTAGEIWYHLVLTWDGQNAALFINAAVPATSYWHDRWPPLNKRAVSLNQPLLASDVNGAYLGGNTSGTIGSNNRYWWGRLAYFAAYDHALSPARVLCHWNAAVTGNPCAIARHRSNTVVIVQ